MLRWSPDELFGEAAAVAEAAWEPESAAGAAVMDEAGFRADYPREKITGLLDRLKPEERDTLYRMVAADIRGELEAEQERRDGERLRIQQEFLADLAGNLREAVSAQTAEMARGTADLAVAIAEQILRTRVEADRGILARSLETIMFKARSGAELVVATNPADCEILKSNSELIADLNIVRVTADPRIEQGGCVVASEGRQWDLTLGSRLEVLAETVRASLSGAEPEARDE